jgi:hypothetical protein
MITIFMPPSRGEFVGLEVKGISGKKILGLSETLRPKFLIKGGAISRKKCGIA